MKSTVGIQPDMQFHSPRVRLRDTEFQRIITRSFTGLSRKEVGPRFVGTVVKRIGRRARLKDNRIKIKVLQKIQQADGLSLLLLRTKVISCRPVDVGYRNNPRTAKLTLNFR